MVHDYECNAVESYLRGELSNSKDVELVFDTTNDGVFESLDLSKSEELKSVTSFINQPWFKLSGHPLLGKMTSTEVPKSSGERKLMWEFFHGKISQNAVTSCSDVRTLLTNRAIPFGESAVESVSAIKHPEFKYHAKTIATVSMPLISGNGRSGLLLVSRDSAPEAGVGLIVEIERMSDGEWRPTRAQIAWVS